MSLRALLSCLLAASIGHAGAAALEVDTFPELTITQEQQQVANAPYDLSTPCAQRRVRRAKELPSPWRKAIKRIEYDCQDLSEEDGGYGMDIVSTKVVAYLKPGRLTFAGLPLIEVRMQDSELWGDHQFILDLPYTQARPILSRHIVTTCHRNAQQLHEYPLQHDCTLEESESEGENGVLAITNEVGGTWVHPDESNPQRTVYADAWSD